MPTKKKVESLKAQQEQLRAPKSDVPSLRQQQTALKNQLLTPNVSGLDNQILFFRNRRRALSVSLQHEADPGRRELLQNEINLMTFQVNNLMQQRMRITSQRSRKVLTLRKQQSQLKKNDLINNFM